MSLACLADLNIFVPVHVLENNINGCIYKILEVLRPTWPKEDISFKLFTDGITNKLVACQLKNNVDEGDNVVLVRIYGNKTDLLIDRKAEIKNIRTLNNVGLAPQIYGIFENGLVYQYFPGETLNPDSVLDLKIWPLIAKNMAKMHKVQLGREVEKDPMVWDKTEQFLSLVPEKFTDKTKQDRFVNSFGSVTKLRIEYERLKTHLTKSDSPIVFAHNDLLLGNVIYNQDKGTVSFIDFEYAAYNYQAFDIANHFNEFVASSTLVENLRHLHRLFIHGVTACMQLANIGLGFQGLSIDNIDYNKYPNKEFQSNWIREYLFEYLNNAEVTDQEVETVYTQVQHHSLASHFFWGIWSLIQFEHSNIDFDFGRYAEIRLNRYFELKPQFLQEAISKY